LICDEAQGCSFFRPTPGDDILKHLAAEHIGPGGRLPVDEDLIP